MSRKLRTFAKPAIVAFLVCIQAKTAWAYCPLFGCQDTAAHRCEKDASGCVNDGPALFYDSECLSFGVESGTGTNYGLKDAEVIAIVTEAFERWRQVDCGEGAHPSFEVAAVGAVPSHGSLWCATEPEANLSVWRLASPWHEATSAVGITYPKYALASGRIFDADVELNIESILEQSAPAPLDAALLTVATHEAGHVLGLDHSGNASAVMAATYQLNLGFESVELSTDDVAGICALFPPKSKATNCGEPSYVAAAVDEQACEELAEQPQPDEAIEPKDQGCALAASATSSPKLPCYGLLAVTLGVTLRRRRSR